jgi:tetratricopeptide (TPR) repeat protein
LELAAARLTLLTPTALLARLEHRLPLLSRGARDLPARQQTLRNTIAWSYDLLQEGEQQLFRRLSVFVGGFTLQAVQAIWLPEASGACSRQMEDEGALLERLAELLDKSLVQAQQGMGGEPRFTMLETIREYATEQLVLSLEEAAVQELHAQYFLRLAEEAWPHLYSPKRDNWLEQLEREDANLRAVLAWCSAKQDAVDTGLRLAGALALYWFLHGSLQEGRMWLEAMLARTGSTDRSTARGRALYGAGLLAWAQGDLEAASARLEEALSIRREVGDKRWTAYTISMLGVVRLSQGNTEVARSLIEEGHSLTKELGDAWGQAFTLYHLGSAAYLSGDRAMAHAHFEESLQLFQEQGDALYTSMVLSAFVGTVSTLGDEERARSWYQQSLPLMRQARNRGVLGLYLINLGDMWLHHGKEEPARICYRDGLSLWQEMQQVEQRLGFVKGLAGLAEIAAAQGQAERAGRLFGAATRLLPSTNSYREQLHRRSTAARERLDAAAFEAGWAAGQAMTEEQAVTEALQDA